MQNLNLFSLADQERIRWSYFPELYTSATGSGTPSPEFHVWQASGTAGSGFQPNSSDRQFIKLIESFKEKIQTTGIPEGQLEYLWMEKMKISANELLEIINPDKISVDITHDKSIFYSLLKNDIVIFFEHFLIEEHDDNDEAAFTAFRGDQKIANYAGTLQDSLYKLSTELKGNAVKPLMVV